MTRNLYTVPSVIVKRGTVAGRDRYNNPVYGPDERIEAPCWHTHQASSEDNTTGVQYVETYMVQWPPEFYADVAGSDEVELPVIGTLHVVGEPLYQPSGLSVEGYCRANLERVKG